MWPECILDLKHWLVGPMGQLVVRNCQMGLFALLTNLVYLSTDVSIRSKLWLVCKVYQYVKGHFSPTTDLSSVKTRYTLVGRPH